MEAAWPASSASYEQHQVDSELERLSKVATLPAFERTLFSSCWEDTETEIDALRLAPGARVLSITASGGRSLNVLRANPREVISVDLNPAQNALLEIKKAGLVAFDRYDDYAVFLGLLPGTAERRTRLFERVRPHLTSSTQSYWLRRAADIERGVLHCGRQDSLMRFLRGVVRSVVDRRRMEQLFEMDSLDEQREHWARHFDTPFTRNVVRLAGSKRILFWIYGQDLYGEANRFGPGEMALEGMSRHVNARLLRDNYFLQHVMLGRYLDVRRYNSYHLQEASFEEARERQSAIRIVTAPLENALRALPDGSVDAFSFSDIFDWIEEDAFHRLMQETIRVARDGARICYRICLVGRYPDALWPYIVPDQDARERLLPLDRSCFYKDLYVGTVQKTGQSIQTH